MPDRITANTQMVVFIVIIIVYQLQVKTQITTTKVVA